MEPEKLKDLPLWFQVAAYLGMFVATLLVTLLGWSKKKLSSALDTSEHKDAVVLSASIADKESMRQLASAIEALCVQIRRNDAQDSEDMYHLRRMQLELIENITRLVSAINSKATIL